MSYRIKLLIALFSSVFVCTSIASAAEQSASESYEDSLCKKPGFTCEIVKPNQTWKQLFPDKTEREIEMRLNRSNVALHYLDRIVVPTDWRAVTYASLSPLPEHWDTHGKKLLVVDLKVFAFGAYDKDGNLVLWGPATGGKDWCEDTERSCKTAVGTFRIYRIQGPECESSQYPVETEGGAPMPYCMHYYKGFALHGSTLTGFTNKSRGCVRLFYSDAKWLNKNFVKIGLKVIVKD